MHVLTRHVCHSALQDHATSVISDAITVLDDSQEELNTLVEGTRALEETDANSPLTVALRDAQKAVEKADTTHAALLRQDEVGDWKGVVAAAPEFSELAHACVGYLGRVRELLAIRMANVQATMQVCAVPCGATAGNGVRASPSRLCVPLARGPALSLPSAPTRC